MKTTLKVSEELLVEIKNKRRRRKFIFIGEYYETDTEFVRLDFTWHPL